MAHLGIRPRTIQVDAPHENGDVESLNGALKRRLKQYLLIRGSSDFESVDIYRRFLEHILEKVNSGRSIRLAEELKRMPVLNVSRLAEYEEYRCRVRSWSTITVKRRGHSCGALLWGLAFHTFEIPSNRVGLILAPSSDKGKEERFLDNCRYIVNNPVDAKMVEHPFEWPWSSFRTTRGMEKGPGYLQTDFLLKHFSSSRKKAQMMYEDFVLSGIGTESPLKEAKNQIFLGSDSFIAETMQHADRNDELNNVPKAQKLAGRPPPGYISRITRSRVRKV